MNDSPLQAATAAKTGRQIAMMHRAHSLRANRYRAHRGSALVLVLIVVAALTLAVGTFGRSMLVEHRAARVHGRGLQAAALADSGLAYVTRMLAEDPEQLQDTGGIYNNPARLQGVLVVDADDPVERGRFAVVAPQIDEGVLAGMRFGLENESTRLNLNTVLLADDQEEDGSRQILLQLPGMTEELADAVLDWIDEDDEPRQFGAEVEYYSGLSPPYGPRNGSLATVEELLLVRGMTPELLFGPDANRNGILDPHESDGATVADVDNSGGELDRGLTAYLTLFSGEKNLRPDGTAKIDVNGDDLELLYAELEQALGKEIATFIVAFRQFGPYNGSRPSSGAGGGQLDFSIEGRVRLSTVLDLIGPRVQARFKGDDRPVILDTPFPDLPLAMVIYLPALMDVTTVNPSPVIPGRININQASRVVLEGIPGLDDAVLEELIQRREPEVTSEQPSRGYETWLLTEGLVTLDEMKGLMPFVTAGGDVHRGQVVGYFDRLGPGVRLEAIWDATTANPSLVFWRDMSHLGRGYPLELLGVEAE